MQPGYSYLKGSSVDVKVDGRPFKLFTDGEHAWTRTNDEDRSLIAAMKGGVSMTVRGTSIRDTYSLDTYSLSRLHRRLRGDAGCLQRMSHRC